MSDTGKLTPTFVAMNGRDKWETLILNGLIGTDEPWIAAMTETLRKEATRRDALVEALQQAKLIIEEAAYGNHVGALNDAHAVIDAALNTQQPQGDSK